MSIGERITALRKSQNISQYQLAQTLGVSRQAVSKWENDLSSPDTLNLIKLADLLNTEVEFLATGISSPSPAPSPAPSPPAVQIIEKIVEVEKPVTVEKIVEVERIVDRVIEKPVIKKVTRIKYRRNGAEYILLAAISFVLGLIFGLLI